MTMFGAARYGTHLVVLDGGGGTPAQGTGTRTYPLTEQRRVPGALGVRYLKVGNTQTSATPLVVAHDGQLWGATLRVDRPDVARDYRLEILVNGVVAEFLDLPSGSIINTTEAFSTAVLKGDEVSARLVRTAGAGRSTFRNIVATLDVTDPP